MDKDREIALLRECLRMTMAWIDAVPRDTELPAMPGFDRDYVVSVMKGHDPESDD